MGVPALIALIWLGATHRNDRVEDDRFSPSSSPSRLASQLAAMRAGTSDWTTPAPVQADPAGGRCR